ncbi:hypothetical protein BP5796_12558 [Coleophoma crateriformis]|uniref:2EXR domain-containing protein n=1 Tax=Coleophoma crateriformis TaxID=565419 RepID=A0A3D8Q7T8_9HELO|nr:hypothetical protein BP5796_12558 [Coleophoma crateriformis]
MPATFSVFLDLPIELRSRIWHHALQSPHFIEVHVIIETTRRNNELHFAASDAPALLWACKESRELALAIYIQVSFPSSNYSRRAMYMNPFVDTIYLDHDVLDYGILGLNSLRGGDNDQPNQENPLQFAMWDGIHRVALCSMGAIYHAPTLIKNFRNMQELIFVKEADSNTTNSLIQRARELVSRCDYKELAPEVKVLICRPAFYILARFNTRRGLVNKDCQKGHNAVSAKFVAF